MGNILRNSIVKEKDASRSFDDWIKNDRDIWETTIGNEFIIADQIKKADVSLDADGSPIKISLLDARAVALEAKQSIGFVSATIRTL